MTAIFSKTLIMQIIFNKIYNLKYLYCSSSLVMIVQLYLILINRLIHQSGLKVISTWFQAYSGSYVGVSFNFLTPTDSRHSVVCHDYLRWHCREQFPSSHPVYSYVEPEWPRSRFPNTTGVSPVLINDPRLQPRLSYTEIICNRIN